MFNLSAGSLFGGLIFGGAGFILFKLGRQRSNLHWVVIGITLMTYTLFVSESLWVWILGAGLCLAAYLFRFS